MDRSWVKIRNRLDELYTSGVDDFLRFAYIGRDENAKIPCPCKHCNNFRNHPKATVESHLRVHGICREYTVWVYHGETIADDTENIDAETESVDEELDEMLHEYGEANWGNNWMDDGLSPNNMGGEGEAFMRVVEDAKKSLYPGNENYTKLSFTVNLLHLKTKSNWSIKSFDSLLAIFKKALPEEAAIPQSFYEAKKLVRDLGFKYEKIEACVNDCILYRKEHATLDKCPNVYCEEPRYEDCRKIPRKVLRYFPLKNRLRRMFIHKETAGDIRWHKEKRIYNDNIMRHPADGEEWQQFDQRYPKFAEDPRCLRLGLSTDGFNPFGNMSSAYSIWPVYIVPYNLPPWKCMKDPFFYMSMIIPGPNSPGTNIDVYLQPLIEELIELWNGVDAYDSYVGERFTLRASLLWTISDFPAYAMLSGWTTKGYLGCPVCMNNTSSEYLNHSRKVCYMGHRRFLPSDHPWRRNKGAFNGEVETRQASIHRNGNEILDELNGLGFEDMSFGKSVLNLKDRKRKLSDMRGNWTKKSIFFDLPYWKDLKIRHNIDIMHVVKNVAESLIGTMMDINGKTKDTSKSRQDLMELGLKKELHLSKDGNGRGERYTMPMASYHFTKEEKKKVNKFLASIKYPDGFASNVSRCVKKDEFQMSGMKSHDYHIVLQRVLPVAIRGSLSSEVRQVISELSMFVKKLCARTTCVSVLEEEEKNIALILCKLEKILPHSFFDIMVHVMVHLPREAKFGGPCQYRWMYPFERKMGTLKGYVNNKARPEGCIAERYIDKECLNFCSIYIHDVETMYNRVERNDDRQRPKCQVSVFSKTGRAFGGAKYEVMSLSDLTKLHVCILNNCSELDEYIREHKEKLEVENDMDIDQRHDKEFPSWFRRRVSSLGNTCHEEIRSLAVGLDNRVCRYSGCMVNGYRFHTQVREKDKKTQNSGVIVIGDHGNNSIDFYGVLKDIVEVEFLVGRRKVLLFKCDWWKNDSTQGMKVDESSGCISVNLSNKWYEDQPYVLAEQVHQVFYLPDLKLGGDWHVVQHFSPRSVYDVPELVSAELDNVVYQEEEVGGSFVIDLTDASFPLARESLPIQIVDASSIEAGSNRGGLRAEEDMIDHFSDDNEDINVEWSDDDIEELDM